jgi:hypothetical protein
VGTPHRVVRRLSDTTTNLQALLQSPLGGLKPAPAPAKPAKPVSIEPVQPVAMIGPATNGEPAVEVPAPPAPAPVPAPAAANSGTPDEAVEAIVSEILPPAITPVIPGDIRPTQRVALRPVAGADEPAPRSRRIREVKSRSWLNRLIGG